MQVSRLSQRVTVWTVCTIGLAILVLAMGLWRWKYPCGVRTAFMPCTLAALRSFAVSNDGEFPTGKATSLECLALLYPDYLDADFLSGLSGDRKQAKSALTSAGRLNDKLSSWVYWPGFRIDDDPKLAIIWEKRSGLGFNGKRSAGHCVGFVNNEMRQIPDDKWDAFILAQEILRNRTISERRKQAPN
jgi:hypothetical protein